MHHNVATTLSGVTFGNEEAHAFGPSLDESGSDGVPFIGQAYQNKGGCSQKTPVSSVNSSNAGGCSQKSRPLPVVINSPAFPGCTSLGLPPPLSGSVLPISTSVPTDPCLYLSPPILASGQSAATLPMSTPVPHGKVSLGVSGYSSIPERDGAMRYCKADGCTVVVSDGNRNQPFEMCARHLAEHTGRLHHDNIFSLAGHDSAALAGGCSQKGANAMDIGDAASQAVHLAQEVKPEIDATLGTDTSPLAVHARSGRCEYAGCNKIAKYGSQGGSPRFCQQHKRVGMYTNRNGRLMISTRDGSAFRPASRTPVDKDPKYVPRGRVASICPFYLFAGRNLQYIDSVYNTNATASASYQNVQGASDVGIGFFLEKQPSATGDVPVRSTPLSRKLCEVPGCTVQPSYGPSGTTRPRFCVGHKKKGMIGLKNRPCLFPGCLTRPHYGLSRGRPVYCASHKKSGMVHLLKESMTLEKERLARNRAVSRKVVAARKAREIEEREALAREDEKGIRGMESPSDGSAQERGIKSKMGEISLSLAIGKKGRTQMQSRSRVEKRSSDASAAKSSRSSQTVDTGSAPSIEFNLLKEARELAAIEAKSTGRRARAPSRKLLEACGILSHGVGQKITKVNEKAEMREDNESSEQWEKKRTSGLTFDYGIDINAYPRRCKPRAATGEIDDCNEGYGINKTGENHDARGLLKRKLTHQKPATSATPPKVENEIMEEAEEAVCVRKNAAQSFGSVAMMSGETIIKRPWSVEKKMDTDDRKKSVLAKYEVEGDAEICRHARGGGGGGGSDRNVSNMGRFEEGEMTQDVDSSRSGGLECAQIGCSKIATHGVNGGARYCKWHRLFGMHEILIQR